MDWGTHQIIITTVLFFFGILIGALITAYYFGRKFKQIQKQLTDIDIDKEQLRSMSSALGRKLSEEQLNKMVKDAKKLKKNSVGSGKKTTKKPKK